MPSTHEAPVLRGRHRNSAAVAVMAAALMVVAGCSSPTPTARIAEGALASMASSAASASDAAPSGTDTVAATEGTEPESTSDGSSPTESSPAESSATESSPVESSAAEPTGPAPGGPVPQVSKLPEGPVTLLSLGDSLTAGQGEDPERGFVGRLGDALEAGGHPGSTVINFGRSGWTSTQLIDGSEGDSGQLAPALEAIAVARQEGQPVIATLLIGSNDLWYLYNNEAPTPAADEQQDLKTYRANLERLVGDLRKAGALVVLGINDDQSRRPVISDPTIRTNTFPYITDDEAKRMTAQALRYADVVREVAADNGALVADFLYAEFFTDPALLNEDGGHPNAAGYDEMTKVWLEAMQPLL